MQPFSDVLADYAAAGSARHYYGYDFQLHVCVERVLHGVDFHYQRFYDPVGVGLLQIVNAMKYSGQYGAMFAAVIIVFLPTFLLYLFLSEKIIVGATSGGVKG